MSYRLSPLNNKDNSESVRYNEIIMKEKDDKLPIHMIKVIETFLKGKDFKKQRMIWIGKIICCEKDENMPNSIKHFLYGKAMLNNCLT